MCLQVIKYSFSITIRVGMPDKVNAKSFLVEVANHSLNRIKLTLGV